MSFNTPVQINYGEIAVNMVNMFVRLSQNMLNPDLVAGPLMIVANEPKIIQLYGQCHSALRPVSFYFRIALHIHAS